MTEICRIVKLRNYNNMGLKTISVRSANWEMDIQIDDDIFDDVYVEACTRILEKNIRVGNLTVSPFMEANIKNRKKIFVFNTYKILINAGYHKFAENLRFNFKKQTSIDLKYEPIKG